MGRLFKALALLILLTVLLLGALVAWLASQDLNARRDQITQWLSAQSQWQIQIDGSLEYHWQQPNTLTLRGLRVSRPGVTVSVDMARVEVNLHALTIRRLTLDNVELAGVKATLIEDILPPAPSSEAQAEGDAGWLDAVKLKMAKVALDSFSWRQAEQVYRTENVRLSIDNLLLDRSRMRLDYLGLVTAELAMADWLSGRDLELTLRDLDWLLVSERSWPRQLDFALQAKDFKAPDQHFAEISTRGNLVPGVLTVTDFLVAGGHFTFPDPIPPPDPNQPQTDSPPIELPLTIRVDAIRFEDLTVFGTVADLPLVVQSGTGQLTEIAIGTDAAPSQPLLFEGKLNQAKLDESTIETATVTGGIKDGIIYLATVDANRAVVHLAPLVEAFTPKEGQGGVGWVEGFDIHEFKASAVDLDYPLDGGPLLLKKIDGSGHGFSLTGDDLTIEAIGGRLARLGWLDGQGFSAVKTQLSNIKWVFDPATIWPNNLEFTFDADQWDWPPNNLGKVTGRGRLTLDRLQLYQVRLTDTQVVLENAEGDASPPLKWPIDILVDKGYLEGFRLSGQLLGHTYNLSPSNLSVTSLLFDRWQRPVSLEALEGRLNKLRHGPSSIARILLAGNMADTEINFSRFDVSGPQLSLSQWLLPTAATETTDNPRVVRITAPKAPKPKQSGSGLPPWLTRINFRNAKFAALNMSEPDDPTEASVDQLDLTLTSLSIPMDSPLQLAGGGQWTARQFSLPPRNFTHLAGSVALSDGKLRLVVDKGRHFGAKITADAKLEMTREKLPSNWQLNIDGLRVSELDTALGQQAGLPHGTLSGTIRGKTRLTGSASLMTRSQMDLTAHSRNMRFTNLDLDAALDAYESAKGLGKFHGLDIPAFLFLGPFGLLIRQGVLAGQALYNVTAMQRGITNIQQSHMDARIVANRALINDFAFATDRHRVVVRGAVDLTTNEYEKVIIALVNAPGCITLEMVVTGPLTDPATELNPVEADSNCTPFYQGPVKHPE